MRGSTPGGRRRLPAALLVTLLAGGGTAPAVPNDSEPDRIALEIAVVGVREGTRELQRRRVVLDAGMAGRLELAVGRLDGGRPAQARCQLAFTTAPGLDGALEVAVTSEVIQEAGGSVREWRRGGRLALRLGTSGVLEIAPAEEPGERLLVSITLSPADGEEITLPPQRVELEIAVWAVQGDEVVLLQRPRLRTLTGQPAAFAFDYPVPAASGNGFEHVRCRLTATPGWPRDGRLPVRVELSGGFPSASGPVLSGRETMARLEPGRSWTTEIQAREGEGPFLRVALTAFWDSGGFDAPGGGPL